MSPQIIISLLFLACVLKVTYGQGQGYDQPCSDSSACDLSKHLTCVPMFDQYVNGICRCQEGTVWHNIQNECRASANSACSTSSGPECVPNASCNTGICKCNANYFVPTIGHFCLARYLTACGNSTVQWAECDITLRLICGGPDPDQKVCTCAGTQVWSNTRGKCVSPIGTASGCVKDDDCVDNGVCSPTGFIRRCSCAPGYSMNQENLCALTLGSSCTPGTPGGTQCNTLDHLTCSSTTNRCECTSDRIEVNGKCLSTVGGQCTTHDDCTGNALCHRLFRTCFCDQRFNYVESDNKTVCLPIARGIGSYCRLDQFDCVTADYQICKQINGSQYGKCECMDNMEPDVNGRFCERHLGTTCSQTNHNCIQNAACMNGICTCLPGSINTTDFKCKKLNGESCSSSTNPNPCNSELGLLCDNNQCVCPIGQEWSEEQMHCVALAAGNCTLREENYCTTNSICTERGICECENGFSQQHGTRKCIGAFGTNCTTDTECNDYEYLICGDEGTCECKYTQQQIWDRNIGKCVSLVGGSCGQLLDENEDQPAMECIDSAECILGPKKINQCHCNAGFVETAAGRCVPSGGSLDGGAASSWPKETTAAIIALTLGLSYLLFI